MILECIGGIWCDDQTSQHMILNNYCSSSSSFAFSRCHPLANVLGPFLTAASPTKMMKSQTLESHTTLSPPPQHPIPFRIPLPDPTPSNMMQIQSVIERLDQWRRS